MRKPKDWGQPCPNPKWPQCQLINKGGSLAIDSTKAGARLEITLPLARPGA